MQESLAEQIGRDGDVIVVGDLRVFPEDYIAEFAGERLFPTNKEFQLLLLFARHPHRLLRRGLIAEAVWDGQVRGRTIDIHVARLRAQLPQGAIETVIRLGYRFVLD